MPISDDGPLYVIVRRSHGFDPPRDLLHDIDPEHDLDDVRERATSLQDRYGRTKDTYRVAELRFVDDENRGAISDQL